MRHLKMNNLYLPATLTAFLLSRSPLASTDFENIGHRWIGIRMQNIFATNLICSSTVVWQPVEAPFQICWDKMWAKEKFGDKS